MGGGLYKDGRATGQYVGVPCPSRSLFASHVSEHFPVSFTVAAAHPALPSRQPHDVRAPTATFTPPRQAAIPDGEST